MVPCGRCYRCYYQGETTRRGGFERWQSLLLCFWRMGFLGGFVIMGKDDMVFEGFGLNSPSVPIFSLLWPVICIDAT